MRPLRHALTLALVALAGAPLRAQVAPPVGGWVVEDELRYRSDQGRRDGATPMRESRRWITIDSVRPAADGRRLFVRLGRAGRVRDSGTVALAADGRVAHVDVGLARVPTVPGREAAAADSARLRRFGFLEEAGLMLPEARLWDLVPVVRGPLRRGARWTDTLDRAVERDGHRQALRGTRVTVVVGDTVVDGRRLWRLRDSATVRYEERVLEDERTLGATVPVDYALAGTASGRWLWDPALGLARAHADSTALAGEAVLRYPDGRTFTAPAWRERVRRRTLHDPASYAARDSALRAELRRGHSGGMVLTPEQVAELRRLREEEPRRIAAGDTVLLYRHLASRAYTRGEPVDTAEMRAMLWFMEDPVRPWRWGLSRDWIYENLRQALYTWPPAAMPDSADWPCRIDACRMLAAQWRIAREPRLDALGLVARAALDPARWADTLLAVARDSAAHPVGARFVEPMARVLRGTGATWAAASRLPMPAPGAGWEAWLEWMNGRSPARPRSTLDRTPPGARPAPRFEESHAVAIRMTRARTGRDVVAELRRAYAAAPHDTARLVFGTMLQGLGALRFGAAELAAMIRSGAPAQRTLARAALPALMRDSATLADSATAARLVGRLLSATLAGTAPWRTLGDTTGRMPRAGPILHARAGNLYVLADSIPAAVRTTLAGNARLVTSAEWERVPLREAAVLYAVGPVRRAGPFVELSIRSHERLARTADQAPALYASWARYVLMEVDGEWVIVWQSVAVT